MVLVCGTSALAHAADNKKVVVAGQPSDALVARLEKELGAMGFDVVRIDVGPRCARAAVVAAMKQQGAQAAACAGDDAVGVWVSDGAGVKLRDVIVVREADEHARDMAAVRAAETTRAGIELALAENDGAEAKEPVSPKAPEPAPATAPEPEDKDVPPGVVTDRKGPVKRTPLFVLGAGLSSVMGVDASAAAFSAEAEIGISRWLAIAPRLDYPIEWHEVDGQGLRVKPGFTGVAAVIPILPPSSFVIPRFGAGLGAAWVQAEATSTSRSQVLPDGTFQQSTVVAPASDYQMVPAGYLTAAVSLRIAGPVRATFDGVLGTTVERLVVRVDSFDRAYWGTPFGALAMRVEVMIK